MVVFKTGSSLIKSGDRLTGLKTDLFWDASAVAPPTSNTQTDGAGTWTAANQWKTAEGTNATNRTWFNGARAIFGNGGAGGAVTLTPYANVYGIVLKSYTGTYTLGTLGREIRLYQGIDKRSSSGACVLAGPIWLQSDNLWTVASTTNLTVNAGQLITNNGYNLTVNVQSTGIVTIGTINSTDVTMIGTGGITKNGSGLLIIGGYNSEVSGAVVINGGVLRATSVSDPLGTGNIKISGGILELYWASTIVRPLGDGPGQIQFPSGESGISQNGNTNAALTINNNANTEVVWGGTFFNPSKFIFNSEYSQSTANITLSNKLDLNGQTRTIVTKGSVANTPKGILGGIVRTSSGTAGIIKEGIGTLQLTANNTFNGGVVVNAGGLSFTGSQSFTGDITMNSGSTGLFGSTTTLANSVIINASAGFTLGSSSGTTTLTGVVSGSNSIFAPSRTGNGGGATLNLNSTANTLTSEIIIRPTANGVYTLGINSLPDSANKIIFTVNGAVSSQLTFQVNSGAIASVVFNNRQFEIQGTASGQAIKISNLSAQTFTINTNLETALGGGTKVLNLQGTGSGINTFNGNITNGGFSSLGITKAESATWILGGTNTYTGPTINLIVSPTAGGIRFHGMQALSPSTVLRQTHSGGSGGFGTIHLLDDSATPLSRSTTNIEMIASNTSHVMSLYVDRIDGTNTGSTIELGNLVITQLLNGNTSQNLLVTGANSYSLKLGAVNLPSLLASSGNWTGILESTTAPLIVSGTVQQVAGSASANGQTLELKGTNINSLVSGNILNSADGTPRVLNLLKSGTGTWTLSGTNAYTGTTAINGSGGILRITGSLASGSAITITAGTLEGSNVSSGFATVGSVTVANATTAILRPGFAGNNVLNTGALVFSGTNSRLTCDSTSTTFSKLMATGNVTLAGVGIVFPPGITTDGTYDLIECTGSISGVANIAPSGNSTGKTLVLQVVGNKLQVVVS